MTKGDKIRLMNDDALSLWLARFGIEYAKLVIKENERPPLKIVIKDAKKEDVFVVAQSILKLLKEEVQEDG